MDQQEALRDIKDTVHRIDSEVRSYRDEQLSQRADIARIDERQSAMHEMHVRLEHKIDTMGKSLTKAVEDVKADLGKGVHATQDLMEKHITQEDSDRRKFLTIGWIGLLALLTYLGKLWFENFVGKA
jgi:hypothetical protein